MVLTLAADFVLCYQSLANQMSVLTNCWPIEDLIGPKIDPSFGIYRQEATAAETASVVLEAAAVAAASANNTSGTGFLKSEQGGDWNAFLGKNRFESILIYYLIRRLLFLRFLKWQVSCKK